MRRAGRHFVNPANWDENARILAAPDYLNADGHLVRRAISDRLVLQQGAQPVEYADFMFQYTEAANFPWVSQAKWIYSQMARWDHLPFDETAMAEAARVFRPDVYRAALQDRGDDLPSANAKVEGSVMQATQVGTFQGAITLSKNSFFDGRAFDPDDVRSYLASLA